MPVSKKRNKKVKNKTIQKEFKNPAKTLLKRVESELENTEIVNYKKSVSKMIAAFAKPLIDDAGDNQDQIIKAIEFSILVWNVSVSIKKDKNNEALEILLDAMSEYTTIFERDSFRKEIEELIKRKEYLFPDDNIMIADFEVSFKKGDFRLFVAATFTKDD